MKSLYKKILIAVTIISTLLVFTGCDLFIKTNDGKVDLKWYMKLTYENENKEDISYTTKVGTAVAAIALEREYSKNYAILKDVDAFINIDTVTSNVDKRFYWDKKEKKVLFTDATTVYTTEQGKKTIVGKTTENIDYTPYLVENNKCYLNIKFIKKFVDINYSITKATKTAPAIISLGYQSGEKTTMKTDKDIEMRTKGDYQNLIVKTVAKGTEVTVIETGKNWDKVKTKDGYIGYVPTKNLENKNTKKVSYKNDDDTYTHVLMDKKVSLAWNQIYNQSANKNIDDLLKNTSGINVLSPTWFSLTDKNGNLSTLAELDYVEKAHKKGIKVWALVNDFTDKKLTKTVLTSTKLRQRFVNNIMYYVSSYELDGVNIDFEYITSEISGDYLQFLRELSVECRKAKKVLSVDNYAPAEWSGFYDREQQLKIADYIMIMNYDEHTTGSKVAGSVSSMSYAEKSIKDTIAEAKDASRIINGIPFYTRAWKETPQEHSDGSGVLIQDATNGNYYLSCEALGMKAAEKAYKDAGVKPTFDKETGQNFVTYSKGKTTYSIWLEDETSIKSRMELVKKYKLAGAAYWALGQEKDSIWKVIDKELK